MNETEPSRARRPRRCEDDLKSHQGQGALLQPARSTDPLTERLLAAAKEAGVPVVGVTETKPAGTSYAEWMLRQLDATEKALSSASS